MQGPSRRTLANSGPPQIVGGRRQNTTPSDVSSPTSACPSFGSVRVPQHTSTRVLVTTSYPAHADDFAGHFVRSEALELSRTGDVVVVAPRAKARHLGDDVRVVEVGGLGAFGPPGLGANLLRNPWQLASAARFFFALPKALLDARPDALEVHWPFPTALFVPRSLHAIPTTYVSHGACVRALVRAPRRVRAFCIDRLLRPPVRWRFVSVALRDFLLEHLDRELAARVLRQSFIQEPRIELPPRETIGRPWPRPALVLVGRLVPSKCMHLALCYAAQHEPLRELDIVMIGDGPMRQGLETQASALGLRLHATGTLSRGQTLGILAGAKGLLFASKAEGCSSVLREAAHYGVPVHLVEPS